MYQSNKITKIVYNNKTIQYKHKNGNISIKSEKSKTFKPNVFILKRTDKLDLRKDEKINALLNLSIYYTWKTIKSSNNNNKCKISAPTRNDQFELPDGSYSVSDIQGYFEYI